MCALHPRRGGGCGGDQLRRSDPCRVRDSCLESVVVGYQRSQARDGRLGEGAFWLCASRRGQEGTPTNSLSEAWRC